MRVLFTFSWTLNILNLASAAVTCQRDSCYNAVAIQQKNSPNLNSRRADCQAVLKTMIEDDKTKVVVDLSTVYSATVTVTTQSDNAAKVKRTQNIEATSQITAAPILEADSEILPRDQIVASGKRPSYASACKNVQSYAVACLCFGVKAAVQYTAKTSSSTRTITLTATATTGFDFIAYLRTEGQGFCTSYLDYTASSTILVSTTSVEQTPTVQTTIAVTPMPIIIDTTTTSTQTIPVPVWRRAMNMGARMINVPREPIPASIRGWSPSQISSACSRIATGQSTINSVETTTFATTTEVETSTSTVQVVFTRESSTTTTVTAQLADTTQIAGSLTSAPEDVDLKRYDLNVPFAIGAFGTYRTNICVRVSTQLNLAGRCVDPILPGSGGVNVYVDSIATKIYRGRAHGIDYQLKGTSPTRTLRFRWYVGDRDDASKLYNYTMTFYEDRQGVIRFDFFGMSDPVFDFGIGASLRTSPSQTLQKSATRLKLGDIVLVDTVAGTITTNF